MRFMQIESVLQTKNRSEPAKNRFSVALVYTVCPDLSVQELRINTVHHEEMEYQIKQEKF